MAMSRKTYQAFADMLRDVKRIESDKPHAKHRMDAIKHIECRISELFDEDNERFDGVRFHVAAALLEGES